MHRQTHRETDTQRDRHAQTDTERDRHTQTDTERDKHAQTDTERDIHRQTGAQPGFYTEAQKLTAESTRIEAPKGMGIGEGCPPHQSTRGSGEAS